MRDGDFAGFGRYIHPYLAGTLGRAHDTQHAAVEDKAGFGGNDFYEGGRLVVLVFFQRAGGVGREVGLQQAETFYRDVLSRQACAGEFENNQKNKNKSSLEYFCVSHVVVPHSFIGRGLLCDRTSCAKIECFHKFTKFQEVAILVFVIPLFCCSPHDGESMKGFFVHSSLR